MADPLYDAIVHGDAAAAAALTSEALAAGLAPLSLVEDRMVPAMDEVGRRFEAEDYFVPELMLSARAMKAAMALLRPLLASSGAPTAGRVVIGTVRGDIHDIGKNLVAAMLEGGGFAVVDLGANVAPEAFVQAIRDNQADIVCLSALLTVTMPAMKQTVEAIAEAGLQGHVRVLVGGAPVTAAFAAEIGADSYGDSAVTAVTLARQLMSRNTT